MDKDNNNEKTIKNRKAFYDYEILEKYEAGIELKGTEVKSIREGRVDIKDSFARIFRNELWLMNAHINPYSHGNINNHDPLRDRKLLMHRSEIIRIITKMNKKGLALIPLAMYFKAGRVKVEIALAKGKKFYDKRESIKRQDIIREEGRHKINM
jgi:SsrA-binding protein